jgi:hypothetical protein
MLTLADSRRIGAFTVYRDTTYQDGRRSYTSRFFALPDLPRLARDADGGPAFDFLWYREPPGQEVGGSAAGGLVTLTVELGPTPGERAMLEQTIPAAFAEQPPAAVELVPIPFRAGTVDLAVAGEAEGTAGELTEQVAGSGPARLAGWERATFTVHLTRDGAALLWQAIEAGMALFQVRYDLLFDAHLDDVQLRVWCDVRSSLGVVADRLASGSIDPAELRERLTAERLAGTELTAEQPIPPEDRETLERLAQQLLEATLASAMFDLDAEEDGQPGLRVDGRVGRPRAYTTTMETHLNHTFTQSFPVERRAVLDGLLRLDAEGEELASRLRKIDLDGGFFRIMEVKVFCTVDFQHDVVETVRATMAYEAAGPSGQIRRTAELVFREGSTVQTFRFDLATPDQRAFRYDVEVWYRSDPEPTRLSFPETDATAVVLDLDQLGVLRVDVELRDVPFASVRSAVVDLVHPPTGASHRMVLDGGRLSGTWEAVVRQTPGPYRYQVAWVTPTTRVEDPWRESTSRRLALDAPTELWQTASVQLISAGEFTELAQIAVDLRTGPEDGEVESLTFTQPGQTLTWEPLTADPAGFRYQVQRTLVYRDGTVHRGEWEDDDRPVLVVRDLLLFEVSVIPRLLDLGGSVALALLELELGEGAAGTQKRTTLVIRDRSEQPRWRVRLGSPGRPAYRYRLTLVAAGGGPRTEFPWREAQDGFLVLRPEE